MPDITITLEGFKPHVQTFHVPFKVARSIQAILKEQAEEDAKESIPAEDALPELQDDALRPAHVLRGARYRDGYTQKALAKKLGIEQSHLSGMENAKRPIGKKTAKKLAKIFKTDYRAFL